MRAKCPVFTILFTALAAFGRSPHRFFYLPTRHLYDDPADHGTPYDVLEIKSLDVKNLSVILFKTKQEPKGSVVHFHGNYGNVSNHYYGAQFLKAVMIAPLNK